MKTPLFKRRQAAFEMWNYYATNTDVWVFGAPDEYASFAELLITHQGSHRIPADERGGMDLLILPPADPVTQEFLVIHERLVYQSGRFNMELIIGGSKAGFDRLAKVFREAVDRHLGDVDSHFHVDQDEPALMLPSVFLNIRGPVEGIGERLSELAAPHADDLLSDMAWRDPDLWGYEPIEDYGSLFGRIPAVKR